MFEIELGQVVLLVLPDHPEKIYGATVTSLPDDCDPAYGFRLSDGSSHRATATSLATDPAAARALQRLALLEKAGGFEVEAAGLRALAGKLGEVTE